MPRFDVSKLKYLTPDDWRVLMGTEMGMKNHELVPQAMVASLANLNRGNVHKIIETLSKERFICWEKAKKGKITGYRLTMSGYDHLAFKALSERGVIASVGKQIGVGKESDVYIAMGRDLKELDRLKDIRELNQEIYKEQQKLENIDFSGEDEAVDQAAIFDKSDNKTFKRRNNKNKEEYPNFWTGRICSRNI